MTGLKKYILISSGEFKYKSWEKWNVGEVFLVLIWKKNNLQSWHFSWNEKSICWLRPRFILANFRHYWTALCQRAIQSTWDLNCPLEVPISLSDKTGATWLQIRVTEVGWHTTGCSALPFIIHTVHVPFPFPLPKVGGVLFFEEGRDFH